MNCPACSNAPLEEKGPLSGLLLDLCASCGGAWMDAGELERLGGRVEGFKEELDAAWKTLLSTPVSCPRCRREEGMERAWLEKSEVEFKVCSGCRGVWIDRARLRALRGYLDRKIAAAAPKPPAKAMPRRQIALGVGGLLALLILARAVSSPKKTAAPAAAEPAQTAGDHERNARARQAQAAMAEARGKLDEAEEEYKSAAEYYYAAILAADGGPEAWRLEAEYAKAGEPIARIAARRGRYDEAESVQKIRLDVFQRHGDVDGQALAWQRLGEMAEAGGRAQDAVERYERAATLYRKRGNQPLAEHNENLAALARKLR